MKSAEFLIEAKLERFYHGGNQIITEFTLDHLEAEGRIDQEGPGIYLTNSADDAAKYGKYIHEIAVKLFKTRMMPEKRTINESWVRTLIWKSPDREANLSNWAEDPRTALNMAVSSIMESYGPNDYREAMESIWGDFYIGHSKEFLSKMRVTGWDGFLLPRTGGVVHFIVFNPEILKIVNVITK